MTGLIFDFVGSVCFAVGLALLTWHSFVPQALSFGLAGLLAIGVGGGLLLLGIAVPQSDVQATRTTDHTAE